MTIEEAILYRFLRRNKEEAIAHMMNCPECSRAIELLGGRLVAQLYAKGICPDSKRLIRRLEKALDRLVYYSPTLAAAFYVENQVSRRYA